MRIEPESNDAEGLIRPLRSVVGPRHLLTGHGRTRRFRRGFRGGEGEAACVVRPGTLLEQWRVLQVCADAGAIVVMQAANTGLTGGSVPNGGNYDRPVVIVNTIRICRIDLLNDGNEVLCLPGATLFDLENRLLEVGRQPHSVIGSSCIGASVVGGIANNSGGALVQRGPAFTELALYARMDETGALELVNELDIDLGRTVEEILTNLDTGSYRADPKRSGRGSDTGYRARLRDIEAPTPARFNANPENLKGASGSAGKLAIFAVRLDTFAKNTAEKVYCIGTNDPSKLSELRRAILGDFEHLPVAAEYLHRDCFDSARRYGKDTYWVIDRIGTGFMPTFFAAKARFDMGAERLGRFATACSDRLLQLAARWLPELLPRSLLEMHANYEHLLILKVADGGIAETQRHLETHFPGDAQTGWFCCDDREAKSAFLLRFSAAGAAIRQAIMTGGADRLVALDIALPRNELDWFEVLPQSLRERCEATLYYGHFLCHVFHQDYIVKDGVDPETFKRDMLAFMDSRRAEYPAEHNVGHLYKAKPALAEFYEKLDPTNSFNAGIGKMPKGRFYGCLSPDCCDPKAGSGFQAVGQ